MFKDYATDLDVVRSLVVRQISRPKGREFRCPFSLVRERDEVLAACTCVLTEQTGCCVRVILELLLLLIDRSRGRVIFGKISLAEALLGRGGHASLGLQARTGLGLGVSDNGPGLFLEKKSLAA